ARGSRGAGPRPPRSCRCCRGSWLVLPKLFQSLSDADDVLVCAHQLEPVEVRDLQLPRDQVARDREVRAEVGVTGGDDAPAEASVVRVVEERDDLFGDRGPGLPRDL